MSVYEGHRFKYENILYLKIYRKPTEHYQYLHRSSTHPSSVFKGFIIGELTKIFRCTNNSNDIEFEIEMFRNHLLKQGYKQNELNKITPITKKIDRSTTLKYKIKNKNVAPPLVLATKYNPCFKQLGRVIRKHWHLIEKDKITKELFPRPPIIAYKKHKNLKDLLTSAKLK